VSAWIEGLHGDLFLGIGLAYFPTTAHRPASFGANTFSLMQWDENKLSQRTPLSATPINGATGQLAPDKWEGTTTLPVLELDFAYVGMPAPDIGRWEVIVSIFPSIEMCEADFLELANRVTIRVGKIVLS
jgi:hypothetical protein